MQASILRRRRDTPNLLASATRRHRTLHPAYPHNAATCIVNDNAGRASSTSVDRKSAYNRQNSHQTRLPKLPNAGALQAAIVSELSGRARQPKSAVRNNRPRLFWSNGCQVAGRSELKVVRALQ